MSQTLPSQAVSLEGELEVQYEDSAAGARLLHFLHVGNQVVRLEFGADPPALLTGSHIRARGLLRNNTLELSSGGSVQTLSLAQPNTFGEQKTLVLLVNFQDNTSTPYTTSAAYATTFQSAQSASGFYLENTYNQTWLTGEVHGWFTLPMNSTTCDYSKIATLAEQAATASGVNVSAFPRRVFAFPQISACTWWGLGTVGGNPSQAWVNGNYAVKVVSHELGHNLGAYHSHSQPCDLSGCSMVEYGDDHDDMGQVSNGHFNAFQKERLGWLNYGTSPTIQTVSASGSYWIEAFELAGTAPNAVKMLKSVDASGNRTWYYVESRSQVGFDAPDTPGVLIHTGADADGTTSELIDLDGTTSAFDAVLNVGQTFADAAAGLSITVISSDSSGASINIVYAGPACAAAAPSVALLPAGTQTMAPGDSVSYSVSVKNNDGLACVTSHFDVGAMLPAGWTATYGVSGVDLAPGASTSTSLSVGSLGTSPAGTYAFTSTATRTNTTGPSGSASANVLVATSLNVGLSVVAGSGNGYQLNAAVQVGPTPVTGAAVTFLVQNPLGKVTQLTGTTVANGVVSVKLSLKGRDPRGTYQVQAVAASGGLSGSATASFVY